MSSCRFPAVFLDRDGVINHDEGYVHHPAEFKFIDGVFAACRHLHDLGYRLVIVTNQSGIGRGYYSEADFLTLTTWMREQFAQAGIPLTGVYYCPHVPDETGQTGCNCRKPAPGMLLQAMADHNLEAKSSLMIGDRWSDLEAGVAAGVQRLVLVQPNQTTSTNTTSEPPAWNSRVEYWTGLADACERVKK